LCDILEWVVFTLWLRHYLKFGTMKTLTGQLRFWTLFWKNHSKADAMRIVSHLRGHVRNLAISAAFSLWGAAAFAQSDLHFAQKPLADYGLVSGSHAHIDAFESEKLCS
jgi:hypothetical protein